MFKYIRNFLIVLSAFIVVYCSSDKSILNSEKFYNFYIDYKKELLRVKKERRVDLDSLLKLHNISTEELDNVKKEIRENSIKWYSFTEKTLSILDSTIAIKDSIAKAKQDSVRSTMFRYQYPEMWKKSRNLYLKNKKLQRDYRKKRALEKENKNKKISKSKNNNIRMRRPSRKRL